MRFFSSLAISLSTGQLLLQRIAWLLLRAEAGIRHGRRSAG